MIKVSIMGAGVMGLCVTRKLISAGYPVAVFDVSAEARTRAASQGAAACDTIAQAVKDTPLVLMFLPGPKEIAACVTGERGILQSIPPGAVIVDHSTVDPATSQKMARAAREKGVGYLDAPVLGRPSIVGNWTLVVGGEPADLEKCRPVLQVLSENISYQGPSGSGNKVKLLNQLMFGAINAITAEVMAIAEKMGIAPGDFYKTIAATRAGTVSNLFKELGARVAEERYDLPTFSVALLNKDMRLAIEMAKEHSAPPVVSRAVEFLNEVALAQGLANYDTAVMWKCFQKLWGTVDL